MIDYIPKSIKGVPIKIIKDNDDCMEVIIECPYCHSHVKYGETMSISGFMGCPNCNFVKGGLVDRVMYLQENDYEEYLKGDFYRNGKDKD